MKGTATVRRAHVPDRPYHWSRHPRGLMHHKTNIHGLALHRGARQPGNKERHSLQEAIASHVDR